MLEKSTLPIHRKINEMPLTKQIPIGLNHLHQWSLKWPPMHSKSSPAAPARAPPSLLRAALAGFFLFLPAHQFWHCALCSELVLGSLSSTLHFCWLCPASWLSPTPVFHVPTPEVLLLLLCWCWRSEVRKEVAFPPCRPNHPTSQHS